MTDRAAIADRLHSLAIHLLRRVARSDQEGGVTGPRLSVLSVLVLGGGPRTMGELAAAEHVRPPTMTRLVQAMQAEGLVARAPAPHDARVVRIRATRAGERVLQHARRPLGDRAEHRATRGGDSRAGGEQEVLMVAVPGDRFRDGVLLRDPAVLPRSRPAQRKAVVRGSPRRLRTARPRPDAGAGGGDGRAPGAVRPRDRG